MGCGRSKQKTVNSKKQVQNQETIQALPTQEPDQPHFSATKKQQEGMLGFSPTQLNVENKGLLRDFYKLGKVLGSGAFGEVRIATHLLTGEKRAIKIISKDSVEDPSLFFKEVTILQLCDHPNIVRIYEFFQDSKKYYLVTEYCNGGELFDKITKEVSFSELQAAIYMKQIMSSVNYCHEKQIVHRDLKPENLLLESDKKDSQLKVIDFGTSTCMDPNKKLNETFGTQLTTKEERSNLEKAFQLMDKNGDGKLSKKELEAGYRKVFGEISEEELDKIIETADTDGSGYVDYTEFVAASMSKQVLLSKEKLELCFKMFDKDGSGTISLEELKEIIGKKGASHDEMVTKLLKEADSSGDGQIDLKEFKELMLKLF